MATKEATFTLTGNTITHAHSDSVGQVTQQGESYTVHLVAKPGDMTAEQAKALAKRMQRWYVHGILKKK